MFFQKEKRAELQYTYLEQAFASRYQLAMEVLAAMWR
jgi:hypothetical protein